MVGISSKRVFVLGISVLALVLCSFVVLAPCCTNPFSRFGCADPEEFTGIGDTELRDIYCCSGLSDVECAQYWLPSVSLCSNLESCMRGCCVHAQSGACDTASFKSNCETEPNVDGAVWLAKDCSNVGVGDFSGAVDGYCVDGCCCTQSGIKEVMTKGECDLNSGALHFSGIVDTQDCIAHCDSISASATVCSEQKCGGSVEDEIAYNNGGGCYCGSTQMGVSASSSSTYGFCCEGTKYFTSNYANNVSAARDACLTDSKCKVERFNVSGVVKDSISKLPLANAKVDIGGTFFTTFQDGKFLISDVVSGYVSVVVSADNYHSKLSSVFVSSDVSGLEIFLESSFPYCDLGANITKACVCGNVMRQKGAGWCCLDGSFKVNSSLCVEAVPDCKRNSSISIVSNINLASCRCGGNVWSVPSNNVFCCADGSNASSISSCPVLVPLCNVGFSLDSNANDCRCANNLGVYTVYSKTFGGYCCSTGYSMNACPVSGLTCVGQDGKWCDFTELCTVRELTVSIPKDLSDHPDMRCCSIPQGADLLKLLTAAGEGVYSAAPPEEYACKNPKVLCEEPNCFAPNTKSCLCGYGLAIFASDTNQAWCCAANNNFTRISSGACYSSFTNCKPHCVPNSWVNQSPNLYSSCVCEDDLRSNGFCCEDDTFFASPSSCKASASVSTIIGHVFVNGTSIPLANVTVNVFRFEPDFWGDSYTTNASGYFRIRNVPRNFDYTLSAVRQDLYYTTTFNFSLSTSTLYFDVPPLTPTYGGPVFMQPLPKWNISGIVYDALTKKPLNDVIVSVLSRDIVPKVSAWNGSLNGTFVFRDVVQGVVTLSFSKIGYAPSLYRINLFNNSFVNTSMTLYDCFIDKSASLYMIGLNKSARQLQVQVSWDTPCDPTGFNLYRCEADSLGAGCVPGVDNSTVVLASELNSSVRKFNDTNLLPNKVYCYRASAEYDVPFVENVFARYIGGTPPDKFVSGILFPGSLVCVKTGPSDCYLYKDEFCGKKLSSDLNAVLRQKCVYENFEEKVVNAALNNFDCSTSAADHNQKCVGPYGNGKTFCSLMSVCDACNNPFGLFHFRGFTAYGSYYTTPDYTLQSHITTFFCDKIPYCFRDRTNVSVNKFYDCSSVSSCYDFKSESACSRQVNRDIYGGKAGVFNNKCLPRNCSWQPDPRFSDLGFGVCRELRLDERCKNDNDCDGFVNLPPGIVDSNSDGVNNSGFVYDSDLDGVVDNSSVTRLSFSNIIGFVYDTDDDNDFSPDVFDPDPNTFVDDVQQNCHLCDITGSDSVFETCDRQRCMLFGSCFWDGSSCLQRSETTCEMFTNESDCIGYNATIGLRNVSVDISYSSSAVDVANNPLGRSGVSNRFVGLSNDYFGFGVCRWEGTQCFKDSDNDSQSDCNSFSTPAGVSCRLDMTPPKSDVPYVFTYGSSMDLKGFIKDNYTSNFRIHYCVGDDSHPCYPDAVLKYRPDELMDNTGHQVHESGDYKFSFDINDLMGYVTPDNLMYEDIYPIQFYDPSEKLNDRVKFFYSSMNLSDTGMEIYVGTEFIDPSRHVKGGSGAQGCVDYWRNNIGVFGFESLMVDELTDNDNHLICGNGALDDGNFTVYYYVEDLNKNANFVDEGFNPKNLEVVKNFTVYLDTSAPDAVVGVRQKVPDLVDISALKYTTDLKIFFNINEPSVCSSSLRKVRKYSQGVATFDNSIDLSYNDLGGSVVINGMKIPVGEFGSNWTLEYPMLPDGLYFFNYECKDRVKNEFVGRTKKIWITSDPSFQFYPPGSPPENTVNVTILDIHITSSNKFDCVYTSYSQDLDESYFNNNWTGTSCVCSPGNTNCGTYSSEGSCLAANSVLDGFSFNNKDISSNSNVFWRNRFAQLKSHPTNNASAGRLVIPEGSGFSEDEYEAGSLFHHIASFDVGNVFNESYTYLVVCNTTMFGLREKQMILAVDRQNATTRFTYPGGVTPFDLNKWYSLKPTLQLSCKDPFIEPSMEFGCDSLFYCWNFSDCVPQKASGIRKDLFIDSDRPVRICYYSQDKGGNRGAKICSSINIDRVSPVIYGLRGVPQVTNQPNTLLSGSIGNFLTSQYWYDGFVFENLAGKAFTDFSVSDFELLSSFKLNIAPSHVFSIFELERFRKSGSGNDERFYSVDVNLARSSLTFALNGHYRNSSGGLVTETIAYDDIPFVYDIDRWYDARLSVVNGKAFFYVNNVSLFDAGVVLGDIHGDPQPSGFVEFPAIGSGVSTFNRSITHIGLSVASEASSSLSETKIIGDPYSSNPVTYSVSPPNSNSFSVNVGLSNFGPNPFWISSKDSSGNAGFTEFNLYYDKFGPSIYPAIYGTTSHDNGKSFMFSSVNSGGSSAEYGYDIDLGAFVIDDKFTYLPSVRFEQHNNSASLLVLNARDLVENGGADFGVSFWSDNSVISNMSSSGNKFFSVFLGNVSYQPILVSPDLSYTLSAKVSGNISVLVKWFVGTDMAHIVDTGIVPSCGVSSDNGDVSFKVSNCFAPPALDDPSYNYYAVIYVSNDGPGDAFVDELMLEQAAVHSKYFFFSSQLDKHSSEYFSKLFNVSVGCDKVGSCKIPPGEYKAVYKAKDIFGNPSQQTYYFDVKDSVPARFAVEMKGEDGFVTNFMGYGGSYSISFLSDSLLSAVPKFGFVAGSKPKIWFDNVTKLSDYLYVANFTFDSISEYVNFEGNASFDVSAVDLQGVVSSGVDIVVGRNFSIDAKGPDTPKFYYPLVNGGSLSVGASSIYITGFYKSLANGVAGQPVVVKVANKSLDFPHSFRSWSSSTPTMSGVNPNLDVRESYVISSVGAGNDTIRVAHNYGLFVVGKFVSFSQSRADGRFYRIVDYSNAEGVGSLTVSPALEKSIVGGSSKVAANTVKVYEGDASTGWFGVNVPLVAGDNVLYLFGVDNNGILSTTPEKVMVFSDPYPPLVVSVAPEQGFATPDPLQHIIANISENITQIVPGSISVVINSTLPGSGIYSVSGCSGSGCNLVRNEDDSFISLDYTPDPALINGKQFVTVSASDTIGNVGSVSWSFEVDAGLANDPVVNLTPGVNFWGVAYSTSSNPTVSLVFAADVGKLVNVSGNPLVVGPSGVVIPVISFSDANLFDGALTAIALENHTSVYSLNLVSGTSLVDGVYDVFANASKYSFENHDWSSIRLTKSSFVISSVGPNINIVMDNITMLRAPKFGIVVSIPSTCSFHTEQNTTKVELSDLSKSFNASLSPHSFAYKNLGTPAIPVYLQNLRFYDSLHTINVSCSNLLGRSSSKLFNFSIIPPNRDKVYYQQGDNITLKYKVGISGLLQSNFNINFSDSGLVGAQVPIFQSFVESPASSGEYIINYKLQGSNYVTGHYKIGSSVLYNSNVLTDIPFYLPIHNLSWTLDDLTNTLFCIDGVANKYFDEVYCNFDVDTIHAKDKKLDNIVERNCFNGLDDDYSISAPTTRRTDTFVDSADIDCQATYYQIRNNISGLTAAIDYSDPETNGIGRLCLGGGSDGYCNDLVGQVQVYYNSRVQPSGNLKLKVLSNRLISSRDTIITVSQIPNAFNIDSSVIGRQQLLGALDKTPPNCVTESAPCDTIVLSTLGFSASGLNELISIPIPNTAGVGSYPGMTIKSTITEASVFQAGPSALVELMVNSSVDSSDESVYVNSNGFSVWCNDNIDNDLDSGSSDPMHRSSVNPAGFDCRDSDCNNKNVASFTGVYRGTNYVGKVQKCELAAETVCNDAFDNDYDNDFGGAYDFNSASGVDCIDPDCDTKQGHPSDANIKCEYQRELSCSDGFDNDALNKKDCEMDVTTGNPTSESAEYDCAAACRTSTGIITETGARCTNGLDDDWDAFSTSSPNVYAPTSEGVDCRYPSGGIRPDTDCNGQTITVSASTPGKTGSVGTGVCQLSTELNCVDSFDNDQDSVASTKAGWNQVSYESYFSSRGMTFSVGADCDDYDCRGVSNCPSNESLVASWCFDGVDNDLDNVLRVFGSNSTWVYGIDCKDLDCNNVLNNANKKCEWNKELSCDDGFDNDGDGLPDAQDPDCKYGFCYVPTPEVENITVDSCMLNTPNEDSDSSANCADPDCVGRVCGLNSKCLSVGANGCGLITTEICGDLIDNNGVNGIDCDDSAACGSQSVCTKSGFTSASERTYPHIVSVNVPSSFFSVIYSDYVHQFISGNSDGWVSIRFVGTNLPAGTVDLQVGTVANPLSGLTNDVDGGLMTGSGFILTPQGTSLKASYPGFAGGNVDVMFKVKATASVGNHNFVVSVTSGALNGVGGADKSTASPLVVNILENVLPAINDLKSYSSAGKLQVVASATDLSGIAYCRFRIPSFVDWSVKVPNCVGTIVLPNSPTSVSVEVEAVDGAGNNNTRTFPSVLLKSVRDSANISFTDRSHMFFNGGVIPVRQEFMVPVGQNFPAGSCEGLVYNDSHSVVLTVPLTFEKSVNTAVCYGSISLSGLKNSSSYSVGLKVSSSDGSVFFGSEKQFFVCKFGQDPVSGRFRCLDSCQLNKVQPFIRITDPERDNISISYPKVYIAGETINELGARVDIFVNSLTESQYQAQVSGGLFNSSAVVLSKDSNTVIARVTDRDQLTNSASRTILFDGVDVSIDIEVVGLPAKINQISSTIKILEEGYVLDPAGSEFFLYYEGVNGDELVDASTTFVAPNKLVSTLTNTVFSAGNYRVEVVPKMLPDSDGVVKYGLGKLFRFNYCPDGTQVIYSSKPASRTRNSTTLFVGTMVPKPDKAELFVVRNDGSSLQRTISVSSANLFSAEFSDLVGSGLNTYFMKTSFNNIVCTDIQRSIMIDLEFAGVKKVRIEGQCEKDSECGNGQQCNNGKCIGQQSKSVFICSGSTSVNVSVKGGIIYGGNSFNDSCELSGGNYEISPGVFATEMSVNTCSGSECFVKKHICNMVQGVIQELVAACYNSCSNGACLS